MFLSIMWNVEYDEVMRPQDPRSTFRMDLYRSYDTYFHAAQREKHDGAKIIPLACLIQKK